MLKYEVKKLKKRKKKKNKQAGESIDAAEASTSRVRCQSASALKLPRIALEIFSVRKGARKNKTKQESV